MSIDFDIYNRFCSVIRLKPSASIRKIVPTDGNEIMKFVSDKNTNYRIFVVNRSTLVIFLH